MAHSKVVTSIVVGAISAFSVAFADEAVKPSIADLDHLLGEWTFVDEATELAGFDYREEGVMNCERALDDLYIACRSEGVSNSKTRHYVHYYSYNDISGAYEMTGLFGNYPAKAQFVIEIGEDGRSFEMRGAPMQNRNGTVSRNWGSVQFSDANRFTWEVRLNRSDEAPDYWPLKFKSTYERVN